MQGIYAFNGFGWFPTRFPNPCCSMIFISSEYMMSISLWLVQYMMFLNIYYILYDTHIYIYICICIHIYEYHKHAKWEITFQIQFRWGCNALFTRVTNTDRQIIYTYAIIIHKLEWTYIIITTWQNKMKYKHVQPCRYCMIQQHNNNILQ